jgi:quercetin dioxygenase-like cupin family protein
LILRLTQHPDGVETEPGDRIVYDLARDEAHVGAARVEGHALVWELTERPAGDWLLRCDRVDFPPGGVAYRHTHPGPGLRVLLHGRIRIETGGESHEYGPLDWWYETGPDPVYAAASQTEETTFVRVLVLPAEWAGRRTIAYVDPADEERPKLQRARIYLEHPLEPAG